MKQKTHTTIILLILSITLLTGCDKLPPKQQTVVINLGAIAEAAGVEEQVKMHMETLNQEISEEIEALSDKLRKKSEDKDTGLVDSPSEEDGITIQTLRKQLIQARRDGNTRRMKEASDIRRSFFDNIMPVARKVALEHGASIILKGKGVYWSDGSVDITSEVIGRMSGTENTQPANSEKN
jgi:Skp family chaperone for outer membrane proteins